VTTNGPPLLDVNGLTKSYGALRAVREVSLRIDEHDIVGIIGPNGSGKTTLFNCISGHLRSDEGSVRWRGVDVTRWPMDGLARAGLARTFQQATAFGKLSVRVNLQIPFENGGQRERPAAISSVDALLRLVNLDRFAAAEAGQQPYGATKRLGLAMALALNPRLVLLDEPAAGLNDDESGQLADLIRTVHGYGITVAAVDHDMGFLLPLCDRIVALEAGEKICEGPPHVVQRNPKVISGYLGERFAASLGP